MCWFILSLKLLKICSLLNSSFAFDSPLFSGEGLVVSCSETNGFSFVELLLHATKKLSKIKRKIKALLCLCFSLITVMFCMTPALAAVEYPPNVTRAQAVVAIDKTDAAIKNILKQTRNTSLRQMILPEIYSDNVLNSIMTGVYKALEQEAGTSLLAVGIVGGANPNGTRGRGLTAVVLSAYGTSHNSAEGVGLPCVRLGVLFGSSCNLGLHRLPGCKVNNGFVSIGGVVLR